MTVPDQRFLNQDGDGDVIHCDLQGCRRLWCAVLLDQWRVSLGLGQAAKPGFGAVMVFWRGSRSGWKGHVAFYLGEDATHYHIRGGNQRNAVTDTRIDKSRLLAARLPAGFVGKSRPVLLTAKGLPVSVNEA